MAMIQTSSPGTVLVVDDIPENLSVLGELLLGAGYRVRAANSGRAALRYAAQQPRCDLVLLDVMMPEMDGYEVLERLRSDPDTRDIPVIFLTALGDPRDEVSGLRRGAADYITKPFKPEVVLARVRVHIEAERARIWLRDRNTWLDAEVNRRMAENELIQQVGIRALAQLAETRDPDTGNHILRTESYVKVLAAHLAEHPRFETVLTPDYTTLLTRSAPLHDIGKVGIPDHILLKRGKLDPAEWEVMKTHAALGARAIELAEADGPPLKFLALAKEIARWHHERWDGRGYPDGLRGDAIPVSARLMALADVFDALTSERPYKRGLSFDEARAAILAGRGTHFDPDVADAFATTFDEFEDIGRRFRDGGPSAPR